jgi:hypothetical protein
MRWTTYEDEKKDQDCAAEHDESGGRRVDVELSLLGGAKRSTLCSVFKDRHHLGLFGRCAMMDIMRRAGFEPEFLPDASGKRGTYVGVRK